jgi:alternate signal-mediated exported protein
LEWKIFMKRILTGSIAGATGIALLLGGAGTFALWNSSAAIAGAPLTAGTLTVETEDVVFWTDQYGTEINMQSYKIVPGDVLTYTSFLDVTVRGDNLHARIAVDHGSISSANSDASRALKILLDKSTSVSVDTDDLIGVPHDFSDDQTRFDLSEGDHMLHVTVTIEFLESFEDVDDDDAKNASALLSNLGVTLTQTP